MAAITKKKRSLKITARVPPILTKILGHVKAVARARARGIRVSLGSRSKTRARGKERLGL